MCVCVCACSCVCFAICHRPKVTILRWYRTVEHPTLPSSLVVLVNSKHLLPQAAQLPRVVVSVPAVERATDAERKRCRRWIRHPFCPLASTVPIGRIGARSNPLSLNLGLSTSASLPPDGVSCPCRPVGQWMCGLCVCERVCVCVCLASALWLSRTA